MFFNRPSESRLTTRPVFQTLVGVDSLLVELYGGMQPLRKERQGIRCLEQGDRAPSFRACPGPVLE